MRLKGRLLLVVVAFVAVSGAAVAAPASQSPGPSAAAKRCKSGYKHAIIAGAHRCLKAGQACKRKLDRQYHRYGFHCHGARLTRAGRRTSPPPPPAGPLATHLGPLVAGEYVSALFRPRIRFTIGGGWTSNLEEAFAFELARETAGATLVFDSFVAQRSVGDVVSLVRSVSGLDATQPIAVTLGGVSGQRFEFTMTATTQVLVEPLQYAFEPGDVGRIYVLDVRGQTVVVIVAAKAADFTAFASAAEQVLATVRFPS